MKTHLRLLGWIYIVLCGLTVSAGVTLCALLALDPSPASQKALLALGPPSLIVAVFALPGLVGGIGLLGLRRWARGILLAFSVLLLPLLPVGTALGGYSLWALSHPETRALFAGQDSEAVRPLLRFASPQFRLLSIMASVAAGFFLTLKIGFAVHHDPAPALFSSTMLTATAILVLLTGVIVLTIVMIEAGGKTVYNTSPYGDAYGGANARAEVRRLRVAELAADPRRAKYAPLVARGEDWSDAAILYHEDPNRLATCVHLRPIEQAVRRAGIAARLYREHDVVATCRIDLPRLEQVVSVAPPIRYAEFFQADRAENDLPTAFLICDEHKSILYTTHPAAAGADTAPWMPAPES